MYRTNTARDAAASGLVHVDAGEGVTLTIPTTPPEDGGVPADHPLLYQSGTRDIASHVADGWAVAARGTTITRQGATVTLSLDVTRTGAPIVPPAEQGDGDITYATVLTLPAGFTPIAAGFISPAKAGTNGRPEGWFDRSGATFRIRDMAATLPTGTRITNVITWQTIDPIPA